MWERAPLLTQSSGQMHDNARRNRSYLAAKQQLRIQLYAQAEVEGAALFIQIFGLMATLHPIIRNELFN